MVEEEEALHYSSVMDSSNYCHRKATRLKASWRQSCFYGYGSKLKSVLSVQGPHHSE